MKYLEAKRLISEAIRQLDESVNLHKMSVPELAAEHAKEHIASEYGGETPGHMGRIEKHIAKKHGAKVLGLIRKRSTSALDMDQSTSSDMERNYKKQHNAAVRGLRTLGHAVSAHSLSDYQ